MFLYLLFIAPLELLMDLILKQSHVIFLSYGVAIIILSLIVNTILLSLYHLARKWYIAKRKLQNQMKEEEIFIKKNLKKRHIIMLRAKSLYYYGKVVQISTNTLLKLHDENREV